MQVGLARAYQGPQRCHIRKSGKRGDKIACSKDATHEHGYHEQEPGSAGEHAA